VTTENQPVTPPTDIPHDDGLLLALRRIRTGTVSLHNVPAFFDRDKPFPRVLTPFLHELFDHGQACLTDPAETGERGVLLTPAGEALLADLDHGTTPTTPDKTMSTPPARIVDPPP
jgi:hypothetical protein